MLKLCVSKWILHDSIFPQPYLGNYRKHDGGVSKLEILTHRPIFHPDGEGAVRMVQMVGTRTPQATTQMGYYYTPSCGDIVDKCLFSDLEDALRSGKDI